MTKKGFLILIGAFILIAGLIIFRNFNPYESKFFIQCPFLKITGLKCPGCGSQRALHYLANFELIKAFKENCILVCSIPYIIGGVVLELKQPTKEVLSTRKLLYSTNAIYVILVIIIAFWILRNVIH